MKAQVFRKKPVEIEAVQWNNTFTRFDELVAWGAPVRLETNGLFVETLEDGANGQVKHFASNGDWIIKGVKGEFYPCKPDIFEVTYDKVEG